MKNIKILKPQPSPKNGRDALSNISNYFVARPKSNKETCRSPTHSPNDSNRSRFATQVSNHSRQQKVPSYSKLQIQTKYAPTSLKCTNHKDKNGKYKIQNDSSCYLYCQACGLQLNKIGKKLISLKADDKNIKMINQSKKYLQQCEQVLAILTYKIGQLRVQKFKIDSRYTKIIDDITQQKEKTIKKINLQYEQQIKQNEQYKKRCILKIEQEEMKLKQCERQFVISKNDIVQNIKQVNWFINLNDFREVMDYYWKNIEEFNQMINIKYPHINYQQHHRSFNNKQQPRQNYNDYKQNIQIQLPKGLSRQHVDNHNSMSQEQSMLYETNVHFDKIPSGRQFTFSKNLLNFDNKGKQAYSIELSSNRATISSESIVQEKILIN